jgi:NRAMP (natural resistance-associated macrophage protein)-like metal ion transporter
MKTAAEPGKHKLKSAFRFLGPGLVTGAADDDPSGIATYSQAGAQFGYGMLWTVVLTWPFMVVVQLISARIGRVTGQGIAANIKQTMPKPVLLGLVFLLVAANTINIGADIAAMGEAVRLVAGGGAHTHAALLGLVSVILQVFVPYKSYAPILKWSTMVLFAYVATVFTVHVNWGEALRATVLPPIALTSEYMLVVVAVLGTTISPYLFFWQASQEVEEMDLHHRKPLAKLRHGGGREIERISIDTVAGMAFSNVIAFFIILTTAATLHASGTTDIQTSAQAAEALRPLAGEFTFLLFSLGIIGTGLLAVPVLAGSAAYALAETFGWKATLSAKPSEARGFYGIIAVATLIGVAINYTPLDPIKMLFWSAVINGIIAVPMIVAMMFLVSNPARMKRFTIPATLRYAGWAAACLMLSVVLILGWAALRT